MSAAPLVTLEHVDVKLLGSPVLHDINLTVDRGDHWGVVGANGSGKSTLLNLIAGTVWPTGEHGLRRYDFGDGPETDAVRARSEIVAVSHELQDRYAHRGWDFTAIDVVLSGLYRTDVPRRRPSAAQRERAFELLCKLGIGHLAERKLLELSRGEQRRVLIARGLAFAPSILLLDEPASGLDAASRADLDAMLAIVGRECTLVCAAHVPQDLPAVIPRYLTIERGRIVAREQRSHEHVAAASNATAASGDAHEIARDGGSAGTPLISVANADVWLAGRHVLADVTWRLELNQHWLVTGANGSGKSTFLRMLHGQLRPALGGEVSWPALGNPRNVWQLRKQVAWLSPELQAAYRYPSTVRSAIASGFTSSIGQTRAPTASESARVEQLLVDLTLAPFADRLLATLSYGQMRLALIGRALATHPRVLLLDEPWEGLDAPVAELLNRTLAKIMSDGTQLVCASHLSAHRHHFTHELALSAGKVTRAGPTRV